MKPFVLLAFAVAGLYMVAPRPKPAPQTHTDLLVGARATTTEALDCYGDSVAVDRVIRSRTFGDEIAANDVRLTEMIRSQGFTLDADQDFHVIAALRRDAQVQLDGGDFADGFRCWVYVPDAVLVIEVRPQALVQER